MRLPCSLSALARLSSDEQHTAWNEKVGLHILPSDSANRTAYDGVRQTAYGSIWLSTAFVGAQEDPLWQMISSARSLSRLPPSLGPRLRELKSSRAPLTACTAYAHSWYLQCCTSSSLTRFACAESQVLVSCLILCINFTRQTWLTSLYASRVVCLWPNVYAVLLPFLLLLLLLLIVHDQIEGHLQLRLLYLVFVGDSTMANMLEAVIVWDLPSGTAKEIKVIAAYFAFATYMPHHIHVFSWCSHCNVLKRIVITHKVCTPLTLLKYCCSQHAVSCSCLHGRCKRSVRMLRAFLSWSCPI